MDADNEPDEKDKIPNLLNPDAEKQTFGRKSQNWPNLMDENDILLNKNKLSFFNIVIKKSGI
ncbi:hypothetical protein Hanom_Chr02g00173571 [Helianthus anomalus]